MCTCPIATIVSRCLGSCVRCKLLHAKIQRDNIKRLWTTCSWDVVYARIPYHSTWERKPIPIYIQLSGVIL